MMNTTKLLRQIMILAIFALVAVAAAGAEAGGERYIVILKSRSGPAPDVARLGGTINFRQQDQVNVTLPRESLAALRADPLVLYVQAVAGADDAPLIGEPDEPTPGAPRRLVPHATAGNQSWSRSYTYDDAGNITNIGSQEFVYDALGRLKEMATSGTTTEQYGYDRYGNQTSRTSGGVLQQIPTEPTTNQLSTGYTYDPAGNLKTGDGYTLSYDALGQAATKTYTAANTFNETYIYTAGEERMGVLTSNTAETSSWWYWSVRDEGGKVLRQYRSAANDPTQTALWIEDYVYRDGLLVGAERPPTMGGRRHFHLDHLGSPRLITSNDGQIVSIHDYLPFGGETTSVFQEENGGFDREDPMKFTGHERDYAGSFGREDGHAIDYMHARYYSPTAGRFLSVDPVRGNTHFPPSFNRYSYTANSPISYVDPQGLFSWNPLKWFQHDKSSKKEDSADCAECALYGVTPDITVRGKHPDPVKPNLSVTRIIQRTDFVTATFGAGHVVGLSLHGSVDRWWRVSGGFGISLQTPGPVGSVLLGRLDRDNPTRGQVADVMTDRGWDVSGGALIGVGRTYVGDIFLGFMGRHAATEAGAEFFPGAALTFTKTWGPRDTVLTTVDDK